MAEREARALRAADLRRDDLRGPEADLASSAVSAIPGVRAALLAFQREFGRNGAVLDGRDIGTVVFPDAAVKLFVTASIEARARRRFEELRGKGVPTDLETVEAELRRRDMQDARAQHGTPARGAGRAAARHHDPRHRSRLRRGAGAGARKADGRGSAARLTGAAAIRHLPAFPTTRPIIGSFFARRAAFRDR